MPKSSTPSVSKTAVWMAIFRALETERSDALFRDPLARRLAGEESRGIARVLKWLRGPSWGVVVRTHIIDGFVRDLVGQGVDTVVNLGAGLDTRPYRLELPSTLRWIEVDFSNVIALKEERLRGEKPRCRLGDASSIFRIGERGLACSRRSRRRPARSSFSPRA